MSGTRRAYWVSNALPVNGVRFISLGRVLLLLSGSVGSAALSFITQLLCARALNVADYGQLVALLAVANIVSVFSGYGVGWFWLQLFGREGEAAYRWVGPTIRLLSIALAIGAALIVIYVFAICRDLLNPLAVSLCLIMMLFGQSLAETTAARLQLEERFSTLAVWQLLTQAGRFLSAVLLIVMAWSDMPHLLGGFGAVGLAVAVIAAVSLHQVYRGRIQLVGHSNQGSAVAERPISLLGTFTGATPYCFCTVFYLVYSQGVIAILERIGGSTAAAMYNSGFLIISAVYLIPSVVYMKYLVAKIFRWSAHDPEMFSAVIHVGIVAGAVSGLLTMVGIMAGASLIIPILFGSRYAAAVPVLHILALAIPVRFVQHAYGAAFFSEENMRRKVYYLGGAAAVCIVLSVILVPPFGVSGAAVAAVCSEVALLLFFVWGVANHVDAVDIRSSFSVKRIRAALLCIEERSAFGSA